MSWVVLCLYKLLSHKQSIDEGGPSVPCFFPGDSRTRRVGGMFKAAFGVTQAEWWSSGRAQQPRARPKNDAAPPQPWYDKSDQSSPGDSSCDSSDGARWDRW